MNHDIIRERIREYISQLGIKISDEIQNTSLWAFTIIDGYLVITIEHQNDYEYCDVFCSVYIQDEKILNRLESLTNDSSFIYGIKSALYSPITGFQIINDNGRFEGFHISKRIFPYDDDFKLKDLYESVQAVVSVAIHGIAFLDSTIAANNHPETKLFGIPHRQAYDRMFR